MLRAIRSSKVVYVHEDLSYAMPGIPDKPKRENTMQLDRPKYYRNQKRAEEEWDNIHDPHLAKNPKSLREAAYARMRESQETISTKKKVWYSRLLQYMVPLVHYFPEIVDVTIQRYNPNTYCIEGQTLNVNIIPQAIWNMLCISDPSTKKEIGKKGISGSKLPSIPLPHHLFLEEMEDPLSMLVFVCSRDSDKMVEAFQLGSAFQFHTQHNIF